MALGLLGLSPVRAPGLAEAVFGHSDGIALLPMLRASLGASDPRFATTRVTLSPALSRLTFELSNVQCSTISRSPWLEV